MAKLQIFRDGKLINEIELDVAKQYIAGRSRGSDILLEDAPEISRSHFKLFFDNQIWKVENLSRFGELYYQDEKQELVDLSDSVEFRVPPFAFLFRDPAVEADLQNVTPSTILQEESPLVASNSQILSATNPEFMDDDRTAIASISIFPFLTVIDAQKESKTYKLEGNNWIIGRDKSCTVVVDDTKLSRRHIEIKSESGAYFVRDLGSSNGTMLNGGLLPAQDWKLIQSGDVLSIFDIKVVFEIKDTTFEERWSHIPAEIRDDHYMLTEPQGLAYSSQEHVNPEQIKDDFKKEKQFNWVRVVIVLIVVGGAGLYLTDEPASRAPQQTAKKVDTESPFAKLSKEQQTYVKDTYRLADRLFKEGRYEMARQEVAKIHQLVPVYEESKNIEKLAGVAIQTQIDQRKAESEERERLEMEEKIKATVRNCRKKISSKIDIKTMDDCLSSVLAMNPDHPEIAGIRFQVEEIVAKRVADAEAQSAYQVKVQKQTRLYSKAVELKNADKPFDAIEAFGAVVESRLPDPAGLKGKAQREIASIQKDLAKKQSDFEKKANDFLKAGNMKEAVSALKKAIEVNPENEVIKGRLNSILSDLKKQMQVLYQEGVLEESVGEIDTAKSKWKKIIEMSVPEEDYYKKSKIKLKKYEAG